MPSGVNYHYAKQHIAWSVVPRLYSSRAWADDAEPRRQAHVPPAITFQTTAGYPTQRVDTVLRAEPAPAWQTLCWRGAFSPQRRTSLPMSVVPSLPNRGSHTGVGAHRAFRRLKWANHFKERPMWPAHDTITSKDIYGYAAGVLQPHLRWPDRGPKCTVTTLLQVMFYASAQLCSLFAAWRR